MGDRKKNYPCLALRPLSMVKKKKGKLREEQRLKGEYPGRPKERKAAKQKMHRCAKPRSKDN